MGNRFESMEYDDVAIVTQKIFKEQFMHLEDLASIKLDSARARALVLTKLEEAYMWVGKAIRDDQIARHEKIMR